MEGVVENASSSEASNSLLMAKVTAICVLGIASFVVGVVPIKLTKLINIKSVDGEKNLVLSLLLCFGGGVLLFTTFIHLQPEVRESFAALESRNALPPIGSGLPLADLIICLGFFLVYLIEELAHLCLNKKLDNESLHRTLSGRYQSKKEMNMAIPRVSLNKMDDGQISYISSNKDLLNSQTTINMETHSHGKTVNSFGGLLAVLALSFHAVFEGLAVGLEGSVQKVWYLFAAIATHKLVIGFCVGVELVTSKTRPLLVLLYIGTFAIVSPIGIGIGIILSESENGEENVIAVTLQGMAGGTLLYVVFFEILSRERDNQYGGVWKLLAIVVGFAVMFGLQYMNGHEHNHGEMHGNHHHDHELIPSELTMAFTQASPVLPQF